MIITAVVEKNRWKFKHDGVKITVDKLPFIGVFLEVEADTDVEIERVPEPPGLSTKDAIRENITELPEMRLKATGLLPRPHLHATFDEETKWQRVSSQNIC